MTAAVALGIGGAFATRPHFDCSNMTQFYLQNGNYLQAGTVGVDYICITGSGTCTYYTPDGLHYYTCELGTFDNCVGCAGKNTTKKGKN